MIVWLASYPRSGNTFCRSVLRHYFGFQSYSVHGDLADIGSIAELGKLVGHKAGSTDDLQLDELRASEECFFIKTHELPDEMIAPADRVFHIVRDGRDACVSYLRYLHKTLGREETTLEGIISGEVPFGLWGAHTYLWHQTDSCPIHRFKFEEITAKPDVFADNLSDILGLRRSRESFPEFETFRRSAPNFFGCGSSGAYQSVFSPSDTALFDLYNSPAMRLAGYSQGGIDEPGMYAYGVYSLQRTRMLNLERVARGLEGQNRRLRGALETRRDEAKGLRRALKERDDSYSALAKQFEKTRNCLGLSAVRWLAKKCRIVR